MNSYICIQFLPDDECPLWFLRNSLYTKLHKAIYDLEATDIGISFPQVDKKLGDSIRIHSAKNKLDELQATNWLGGLSGYCKISEILPVPDKVKGHQTISRIRQNMSITRLQKKVVHQKSKGYLKTDKDIMAYEKRYKEKMFKTGLDNPYLEIQSTSNGHKYRRYIQFGELQDTPITGEFDSFGLSKTATVPWF